MIGFPGLITSPSASLKQVGKQRFSCNQCLWQSQKGQQAPRTGFLPFSSLVSGYNWYQLQRVGICRSCASCPKISKIHRTTPVLKKKLNSESQLIYPKSQGQEEADLRPEFESNPRQETSCCIFWAGLLERFGQSKCPMVRKQSLVVAKLPSSHTKRAGIATNLFMM